MKVTGLNHITLAVADVERSLAFCRDVPGLNVRAVWPEGACLDVGALWLCLSQDSAAGTSPHPDYTHFAFSVSGADFHDFSKRLTDAGVVWKSDRREGASTYFLDRAQAGNPRRVARNAAGPLSPAPAQGHDGV